MKEKLNDREIHVGLCAGRHPIKRNDDTPVDEFVFDEPVDIVHDFEGHRTKVFEWMGKHGNTGNLKYTQTKVHLTKLGTNSAFISHVYLYVTGLAPLLTAFLHCWKRVYVSTQLTLMHYDRETNTYVPERWANYSKTQDKRINYGRR